MKFVKNINTDLFNATFVRTITELCHDVGKKVCLEGVETEIEYNAIKDKGIELIQGFFFGRPVPADVFESLFFQD
ncbi:EAL domain-containing protein [Emergencia timonensis]|uniref:EAL domain-containing protein n=1 Tax=Emergencia timonensis TaxID=1776384 RepID=UPI002F404FFA